MPSIRQCLGHTIEIIDADGKRGFAESHDRHAGEFGDQQHLLALRVGGGI